MGRRSQASRAREIIPPALAIAGVGVGVAAAAAAITGYVARLVVTPARRFRYDQRILDVSPDHSQLTLESTPDAECDGSYGFWLEDERGYLLVGGVISRGQGTVTRRIEAISFGDPRGSHRGRFSSWYYLRPEQLGFPVESVEIPTEGGSAPAWLFPPRRASDMWAIHVHGRGTKRQETLRAISTFRARGYTNLVASYRNDGDAPNSADSRYGLGSTEWQDIDAALSWAIAHGARHVVLFGWSMGGAIVLQTATRSEHTAVIDGLVLDSPVVNWVDTLNYQARLMRLPAPIARGAMRILGAPWGGRVTGLAAPIDLAVMDFVARAAAVNMRVLLMHSDDDGYVPPDASRALAAARSDIVTYVPFTGARHTKLWNADTDKWTSAIDSWLRDLPTRSVANNFATRPLS